MRLNKIERDLKINDLKLNFSKFWTKVKVFVGGSFLVANIAACTPAVEDVNATSLAPTTTTESVVPSSSEEVASSEVTQSSEVQPTESTEVVEPTEEVIENPITAEEAYVAVTELSNTYSKTAYAKYIPTIYFAIHYDEFTVEEKENYQNLFALSDEELDANYVEFMHLQREIINNILNYSTGGNVDVKYTMDDIIKIEDFLNDDKDKETAIEFDNYITEFFKTGNTPDKYMKESKNLAPGDGSTSKELFLRDYIFSSFSSLVPKKSFFSTSVQKSINQ